MSSATVLAGAHGVPRALAGADVLVPQIGTRPDELGHEPYAFGVVEHRDQHAVLGQPTMPPDEGAILTDDHIRDAELPHEPAAVPARRKRGDHDGVAVARPAPGVTKRGGLGVRRGVAILHPAVVATAEQRAVRGEQRGPDRDATLGQPRLRLLNRHRQHPPCRRITLHPANLRAPYHGRGTPAPACGTPRPGRVARSAGRVAHFAGRVAHSGPACGAFGTGRGAFHPGVWRVPSRRVAHFAGRVARLGRACGAFRRACGAFGTGARPRTPVERVAGPGPTSSRGAARSHSGARCLRARAAGALAPLGSRVVRDRSVDAEAVVRWFDRNARDLPWRRQSTTPWGVLVSEVMLQQTQVSRVAPVWTWWMARWPRPSALAAEPAGEVLRAWGKLGYPRRALRLHQCAGVIAHVHDDAVPRDVDTLLSLPGIGSYTARAVAAFAYGQRCAVVDTNVRRVIARAVHGRPAAGTISAARDLSDVGAVLPAEPAKAARFSAALMEIGAVLCTARAPRCAECPLRTCCAAPKAR